MPLRQGPKVSARLEVEKTLELCDFCTRKIGISYKDDVSSSSAAKVWNSVWYTFSLGCMVLMIAGEIAYVASSLTGDSPLAGFVSTLHILGYGVISLCKGLTLWFKRSVFRQVVKDLVDLWPVYIEDKETAELKRNSVSMLRLFQIGYVSCSFIALVLNGLPQVLIYVYHKSRGSEADLGFVWSVIYPFDKTKTIIHEFVFIYETFVGVVAVVSMLGTDTMFTAMCSHISMLLRVLQIKIRSLGHESSPGNNISSNYDSVAEQNVDCYDEIVSVIKIHQRIISYYDDLEEVFGLVNLSNVLLSSVDICCVLFNIVLLEPWTEMSNKFFFGTTLAQVGFICWYADDVQRASVGVADAVYSSGWYKTNGRCRRALLLLLQRSQKPLYFTALKFRNITIGTYSSILTTSYSYFTLLYTMYKD